MVRALRRAHAAAGGGAVAEISPDEARKLFPPLGPVHRALYCTSSARVDGRGMAAALRSARRPPAASRSSPGRCTASPPALRRRAGGRHVTSVEVEGHHNVECAALAVAGGAWTAAMGEWLGQALPVGPTKGQIVHLGVEAETGGLADRPTAPHALPRAVARGAGGLRRHLRARRRLLGARHRGRTARAVARVPDRGARASPAPPTARPASGCGRRRPTTARWWGSCPGWSNVWVATGHGANGLLARAVFGPGCWPTGWPGAELPGDEVPLPPAFDPARFG